MNPLISFIAPVYNFYPIMVDSVLLQSYKNVEVVLVHDGEPDDITKAIIQEKLKDARVKYLETDRRYNDWGHTPRDLGLKSLTEKSDFVVISGGDNYYAPGYCTELLAIMTEECLGVYCNCVHDKLNWITLDTRLEGGYIDGGCIMVKTSIAKEVGWFSRGYAADWHYILALKEKYGNDKFLKVNKTLFMHN